LDDGAMQLSFTLPVPLDAKAREAAKVYVMKLGFEKAEIVYSKSIAEQFSFFVCYGRSSVTLDFDTVVVEELEQEVMTYDEINKYIEKEIGRKVVIVGACTGTDAHTVGIDAIMNMKGYNHHWGLERYPMIEAYNLGAQVPNEELIKFSQEVGADAVLVSQVVTGQDSHIKTLTEFVELLEAEGLRDKFITVAGGPRIGNKLALEIGYDVGFGRSVYSEDVATYVVEKIVERKSAS